MNLEPSKPTAFRDQRLQRRGVGSIEHVLIVALILAAMSMTVSVLSQNMNAELGKLADHNPKLENQRVVKKGKEDEEDEPESTARELPANPALVACFFILSTVSLSAIAMALMRNSKRGRTRRGGR